MGPVLLALICVLITTFLYIIYKSWKVNQYWKERGIPYIESSLFTGKFIKVGEAMYKQFPNEPMIGFYDLMKPTLMLKDADLIEKVFIKDFAHFVDHGILPLDEERNPLDTNLFSMTGKRWKAVRSRISPIFTTGKLRLMFESMSGCGDELIKHIEKGPKQEVELKDILSCFALDTIGSCGFGIDSKSLSEPDSEFRRIAKEAFQLDTLFFIKMLVLRRFPALVKFLNITFGKPHVVKYFSKIIKETLQLRREKGFKRNDFVQLMMQLQDKGYVEMHARDAADDYLNIDTTAYTTEKFEITDEQITGHAVFFLTGGFDTISATMLFTILELSRNPTIQEKVREEIQREVKQAGSLTYDAVKEMHYLEQCVKEALRMYPPAQMLDRCCTKEYTFPNGLTIQPGLLISIPVMALHNDPKYFPEPRVFRPERFDPDQKIPACAYIPFGNGPRMCIAMRFAMMEVKYCTANLLMNYNVTLSPKTQEPIKMSTSSLITTPEQTIYFNITKLNNL